MTFDSDEYVRKFTFHYSLDIDLCGPTSTDYEIEVVGEVGSSVKMNDLASFTLTLKNPCINENFVTI